MAFTLLFIAGRLDKQVQLLGETIPLITFVKLTLAGSVKTLILVFGIEGPTYYPSQNDGWFLDNDFHGYDRQANRALDILKARLMLQSSHNSRDLQSWKKYLAQIKEIQQSWTTLQKFNI